MEEQEHQPAEGQAKPGLLYHYTTQAGLDGILSSDSIWATHFRFMNDSMERLHGLTLFKEALFRGAYEKFKSLDASSNLVDYLRRPLRTLWMRILRVFVQRPMAAQTEVTVLANGEDMRMGRKAIVWSSIQS